MATTSIRMLTMKRLDILYPYIIIIFYQYHNPLTLEKFRGPFPARR
jgi:hypothetical protein